MNNVVLNISDLNLTFNSLSRVKIFENLNFQVQENELIGINAPSGSGKTTLFKLIMNYLKQDSGEIKCTLTPSLISQTPLLNPFLTVNEIIDIECHKLHNRSGNNNNNLSNELLIEMDLKEVRDHLFSNLSGGQKQRVVLLTKLISKKRFILADEPFHSLDRKNSEISLNIFLRSLRKWNITFLMTSHNPSYLEKMDKIYTIERQKLKEI